MTSEFQLLIGLNDFFLNKLKIRDLTDYCVSSNSTSKQIEENCKG